MNNLKKYNEIFMKVFSVEEKALEELEYQGIDEWDSVGHMELIAELEDGFDIMMDTDDIIDFSSYKKGIELLKKYQVEVQYGEDDMGIFNDIEKYQNRPAIISG